MLRWTHQILDWLLQHRAAFTHDHPLQEADTRLTHTVVDVCCKVQTNKTIQKNDCEDYLVNSVLIEGLSG